MVNRECAEALGTLPPMANSAPADGRQRIKSSNHQQRLGTTCEVERLHAEREGTGREIRKKRQPCAMGHTSGVRCLSLAWRGSVEGASRVAADVEKARPPARCTTGFRDCKTRAPTAGHGAARILLALAVFAHWNVLDIMAQDTSTTTTLLQSSSTTMTGGKSEASLSALVVHLLHKVTVQNTFQKVRAHPRPRQLTLQRARPRPRQLTLQRARPRPRQLTLQRARPRPRQLTLQRARHKRFLVFLLCHTKQQKQKFSYLGFRV
jgi:hypothetical protein